METLVDCEVDVDASLDVQARSHPYLVVIAGVGASHIN